MPNPTVERYPELISLAVHEFRTPASVVGGYLRMLQRDVDTPLTERQRKMIEEAEKSTTRIVTMLSELSDIGKIDSGIIKGDFKPIDLAALLTEVADQIPPSGDRRVNLMLRSDGSRARMHGDAARLGSAVNAVFRCILREYPGPATIVAERRRTLGEHGGATATVVVADAGAVADLFGGSFVGFDEKRGGMGLAVPLARRIVEQHGGRLLAPAAGDDRTCRGSAIIVLPITE